MRYTLLDIVQTVLSSIGGDEVNSINDTVESSAVAKLVKTAYYDLITTGRVPEHLTLLNLTATSTASPTAFTKPENIDYIKDFKYNKRTSTDTVDDWGDVLWMPPIDFLNMLRDFDQTDSAVSSYNLTIDGSTTKVYYKNNKAPDFWTSWDDAYIICDSYDVSVDANLQSSKSSVYAKMIPTFTMSDTFVPDLDTEQFTLLLNEVKAAAWAEEKQTVNARAEKKVREGRIRLERNKWDLPGEDRVWQSELPNYGRRR